MEDSGGQPVVLIAAGGTGGHLFPAESLARALEFARYHGRSFDRRTRRPLWGVWRTRHLHYPERHLRDARSARRRPHDAAISLGSIAAYALLGRLRPAIVVGFGGYPTIPPVVAARARRIPAVIHEQNAVLGRANRFLAPRVAAIATGFAGLLTEGRLGAKTTYTGNPVRPAVVEAAGTPYPDPAGAFRILIFGGSQGARVMADVVPAAIELVPMAVRARLAVIQQAREEDIDRVRGAYARMGVAAEVEPFFRDLPLRMAQSHVVVARSAPRQSPNWRRSDAPLSWCRCRMRSTRTSAPTP